MKVTKVSYKRGVTINMGDFESIRLDAEMEAAVDADEDPADVYQHLKKVVRGLLKEEVQKIRGQGA